MQSFLELMKKKILMESILLHFDFEGSEFLRLAVLKSDDSAKFQNWWHIKEL